MCALLEEDIINMKAIDSRRRAGHEAIALFAGDDAKRFGFVVRAIRQPAPLPVRASER